MPTWSINLSIGRNINNNNNRKKKNINKFKRNPTINATKLRQTANQPSINRNQFASTAKANTTKQQPDSPASDQGSIWSSSTFATASTSSSNNNNNNKEPEQELEPEYIPEYVSEEEMFRRNRQAQFSYESTVPAYMHGQQAPMPPSRSGAREGNHVGLRGGSTLMSMKKSTLGMGSSNKFPMSSTNSATRDHQQAQAAALRGNTAVLAAKKSALGGKDKLSIEHSTIDGRVIVVRLPQLDSYGFHVSPTPTVIGRRVGFRVDVMTPRGFAEEVARIRMGDLLTSVGGREITHDTLWKDVAKQLRRHYKKGSRTPMECTFFRELKVARGLKPKRNHTGVRVRRRRAGSNESTMSMASTASQMTLSRALLSTAEDDESVMTDIDNNDDTQSVSTYADEQWEAKSAMSLFSTVDSTVSAPAAPRARRERKRRTSSITSASTTVPSSSATKPRDLVSLKKERIRRGFGPHGANFIRKARTNSDYSSVSADSKSVSGSSVKGKLQRRLSANSNRSSPVASVASNASSKSSEDTMASSKGSYKGGHNKRTSPNRSPLLRGTSNGSIPPRRRMFTVASEVESGQITSASAAAARVSMDQISPVKSQPLLTRRFTRSGTSSSKSVTGPKLSTRPMRSLEEQPMDGDMHSIAGASVGGEDPELEGLAQEAELKRLLEQSTIALEAIRQSRDDFARRVDVPDDYVLSPVIEVEGSFSN